MENSIIINKDNRIEFKGTKEFVEMASHLFQKEKREGILEGEERMKSKITGIIIDKISKI